MRKKLCRRFQGNEKGFSLVEMAMVLVIMGLVFGMGIGLIQPLTKRAKEKDTKKFIDDGIDAVISYVSSNNELPPDTGTSSFFTIIRKPDDPWGRQLIYIFDSDLTNSASGGVCERRSTNIDIRICDDAGCSSPDPVSNVAFLVLTSSWNMNNQTAAPGGTASAITIDIFDKDLVVDSYPGDVSTAEPNDDIVSWITLDELRTKAGCTGPQLRIINNDLPSGKIGSSHNASVYADGGVPGYQWCWERDAVKGSPPGVSMSCGGPLPFSGTCSLISGTWGTCTSLTLSGTPTGTANNYMQTFFVRDANSNITGKPIVLKIDP